MNDAERTEIIEATRAEQGDAEAADTARFLDLLAVGTSWGAETPVEALQFVYDHWGAP
ncbi:hypothetical protein [Nocardia farcinica]|uniref:hypothetical protein n=1 Tax=Nocardia farcinica TaxID=37329 RepID=UPI002457AE47|nr:hypothetical protein [Nocardia farcinica]